MSIAEHIELIVSTRDAVGGHADNFMTVLFAYLVMVYLVSDKLTRFQIWSISLIYSAFLFLPANAVIQDLQIINAHTLSFYMAYPVEATEYLPNSSVYPAVCITLAIFNWLLSVGFTIQRRKRVL